MGQFRIENKVLLEYDGKDEVVIVPDNVEVIGEMVFQGNMKVKKVILPATIRHIRAKAFFDCEKLEIINLPDGIGLGESVFDTCIKLKKVSDKDELIIKKIGAGAFCYCKKLETKIIFDLNSRKIENDVFYFCEHLKHVVIQEKTRIGSNAFGCCKRLETISDADEIHLEKVCKDGFIYCNKLRTIINTPDIVKKKKMNAKGQGRKETNKSIRTSINKNVSSKDIIFEIDNGVLKKYNSKLSVVHVPEEVSEIGEQAFAWNEDITDVYFQGNIAKIGKEAFLQCENLKTIQLPHNIVIEEKAFEGCISLETITNHQIYVLGETGKGAFENCERLKNDIEIVEGIVELNDDIFAYSYDLKRVFIPDSLKKLGENCFGDVEEFVCKRNVDMYLALQEQGYECIMTERDGRKKLVELGEMEEVDENELMSLLKKILVGKEEQLPEWKSIFPEKPFTVEEQWLYGIHPDDETYKKILELEVIRKYSGKWRDV